MFPIINFTMPVLSERVSECIILHKINQYKAFIFFIFCFLLLFIYFYLFIFFLFP